MTGGFDPEEKRTLARRLAADEAVDCPRCGDPLERRSVPPRSEVAYVRDRIWLICGGCGASGVLDRRSVEREGGNDGG